MIALSSRNDKLGRIICSWNKLLISFLSKFIIKHQFEMKEGEKK